MNPIGNKQSFGTLVMPSKCCKGKGERDERDERDEKDERAESDERDKRDE